jgi:hypothetical protein
MKAIFDRICTRFVFVGATLCATLGLANAHDVAENRLSLVLRDDTHIALTFYIDYPKALQQALEPKRTFSEFLLMYSAMPKADFQQAVTKAQAILASQTIIKLSNGEPLLISAWRWPDPASTQSVLQQKAMQSIVAGNDHKHDIATEVQANAIAQRKIDEIALVLPKALGSVLVVSYKPKQTQLPPAAAPLKIKF